ncbi:MAG: BMP family ABC transporter substrate-binding protein [Dorea sp.]|nr:BMP family ABC transporter substrate-binding protein [Dorea sp.]
MPEFITLTECYSYYDKACHLGKKESGSLAVLDNILKEKHITAPTEMPLGIMSIPAELIVGTKNEGRSTSFSKSFYPLLAPKTEFADKWASLCKAHLTEGIHDPIKCYEFFNEYYILEGNKRVSVLKFFDAVTIPANVIRIIPPQSDDLKTRIYYEYMDFFNLSRVNFIYFSKTGSFSKLQRLMNKKPNEVWSDNDRTLFSSTFSRFSDFYNKEIKKASIVEVSDAFLYFITLYNYDKVTDYTISELKDKISLVEDEFELLTDKKVELKLDPSDNKKTLLQTILPKLGSKLRVAFVHERNSYESGWTHVHELGMLKMSKALEDDVEVMSFDNTLPHEEGHCLDEALDWGADVIFTTSSALLKDTLKASIENPDVKFLNCSLYTAHSSIRTYYARIHEVKFLIGAIAGAMCENGKIGYIADYPLYGTVAAINAFALGAKMVNPRAKIYLQWSKIEGSNPDKFFSEQDIHIICGRDNLAAGNYDKNFGLYMAGKDGIWNMAMPIWDWSVFYQKIIEQIMNGNWKKDESKSTLLGVNYWWGMSAGIVDVICSHRLPIGTLRLIDLLKDTIMSGDFSPFTGVLYTQDGHTVNAPDCTLSNEEIIKMDWLVENVVGEIPPVSDFDENAKLLTAYQGLIEEDKML